MRASTLEKRARIIKVATKLFIEQGYKDTSLDQIVAICGGSKQTLYRYFTNKEGLFTEVLTHNTKSSLETVFQLSKKQGDSLQTTLEQFAIKYLKGICSNPVIGLFRIVAADFNKHETVAKQYWQSSPQSIHQYLIDFLETDESCQELNIDDASLACDQLLSLIRMDYQNMAMVGIDLPKDDELQAHVKKAVDTFLAIYQI